VVKVSASHGHVSSYDSTHTSTGQSEVADVKVIKISYKNLFRNQDDIDIFKINLFLEKNFGVVGGQATIFHPCLFVILSRCCVSVNRKYVKCWGYHCPKDT
jgi:hypothetical protein